MYILIGESIVKGGDKNMFVKVLLPNRQKPSWIREDLIEKKKAKIIKPIMKKTYKQLIKKN